MDLDLVDVLLVEDSSYEAELIILELKKHNIANNIFHVKDGEEALNFIFGIEVLQALKADERTRAIPVVMLTSSKEDPDIKKCYLAGVNSYIVKPVDFKGFADAIQNLGFYWLLLNQRPI
jgi:two-component system response regulator